MRGEYLFPREIAGYGELTRIIKAAAVDYGWDTRLRWTFHALRHGGAQEIVRAGGGVCVKGAAAAITMPGTTLKKYAMPNDERTRRMMAKDFSFTEDYASEEADSPAMAFWGKVSRP
jgi:hypothetical protein